jgi:hypothetical protein
MKVSRALAWLCEEPDHSFTLNMVFRRGWPALADFFLMHCAHLIFVSAVAKS